MKFNLRKHLLLHAIIGCFVVSAEGQTREKCTGICDSLSRAFVWEMTPNPSPDIPGVINYWEDTCGVWEVQNRARLMYAIAQNAYQPALWDTFLYSELPWYENRLKRIDRFRRDSIRDTVINRAYDCVQLDGPFDRYTFQFAGEYLTFTDLKPSERIALTLLAGDDTAHYDMLRTTNRDSSILAALYQDEVKRLLNKPRSFIRFGAGVWKPLENTVLGTHPEFFISVGTWFPKWGGEVDLAVRPGPSKDSFTIENKRMELYSNSFLGWSSNAYITGNLSDGYNARVNVKAGIGWDAVSLSYEEIIDDEEFTKLVMAHSFSAVIGFEYALLLKDNASITIGVMRHFTDYSDKRTDVKGQATSFRIGFAPGYSDVSDTQLRRMRFDPKIHSLPE